MTTVLDYKITAFDLKLALLEYFRFSRQWICVDEFRGADVITDTGKRIIEVEVKVDKGDLENKESYKTTKHHSYRTGRSYNLCHPNMFYFCVPEALVESAHRVCEKLNPKYGIIAFNPHVFKRHIQWNYKIPHKECNRMARSAKELHSGYVSYCKEMARRLSSVNISLMGNCFSRNYQDIMENQNGTRNNESTRAFLR